MNNVPAPPSFAGAIIPVGLSRSTVIAAFDFETYSPAGFVWNTKKNKHDCPRGANKKGLSKVGACVYSEHPDCEVLSLAYDLKSTGNYGVQHWTPSYNFLPRALLDHITAGGLLEAWNVAFEYYIWQNVCVPKYGFPPLNPNQLRCAMAKARANALPGKLEDAGEALNIQNKKSKEGERLIKLFSIPRDPSKKDPRTRILLSDAPEQAKLFFDYNIQDVKAESEISELTPDLSPEELIFWQHDQIINRRGLQVDTVSLENCIKIIEQARDKYNLELSTITSNQVGGASKTAQLLKWVNANNFKPLKSLKKETLDAFLNDEENKIFMLPKVRRVLEIRQMLASAAVKKVYAVANRINKAGRICDLFIYHGARTGRATGAGVQPQNLPSAGLKGNVCEFCSKHSAVDSLECVWCGADKIKPAKWNINAVNDTLEIINTGSLECLEMYFGDPLPAVKSCLRSLIVAKPGHDFICSDFHSIEAVVVTMLAGETWRENVFRTHGQIYEMTAAMLGGISFSEIIQYAEKNGQHHPLRKKGKVVELFCGYQGWIGAFRRDASNAHFSDEELKEMILAWRRANPKIVELWGGQFKNNYPQYFGLEGACISAILKPGEEFEYRRMVFLVHNDVMYAWHRDFSGAKLTYHHPRLEPAKEPRKGYAITYLGYNSNAQQGKTGWLKMYLYGGKLTENFTQHIARYILMFALKNLEDAGYPIVLHVHDEALVEVPKNFGSVEEFERIMSIMPPGAKGWPIKAMGGWRGERYRK